MDRINNFEKAVSFLVKSVDEKTGGSRAFYSRILYPIKGWSDPYPETSGYIIPTLFAVSKIAGYEYIKDHVIKMAEWLLSIQREDGSMPGGLFNARKHKDSSIFNSAQILIGLNAAWDQTSNDHFLQSASKITKWLTAVQENDGTWSKFHYNKDFFPSYYTRVAWPMLQTALLTNDKESEIAAIKTLDYINNKVLENGFVKDAGFAPDSFAFLHTIAYTIRGFLESYLLTENENYYNTAFNLAYKLMRKYELRKRLAGAYFEDFKEINWYRCLTGEAQIAIIWLKLFDITDDVRFVNAASKLLDDISGTQPKKNSLFFKSGGLYGSYPYYGRYISLRQPNWATKFYIDAIMLEENIYKKIERKLNI